MADAEIWPGGRPLTLNMPSWFGRAVRTNRDWPPHNLASAGKMTST